MDYDIKIEIFDITGNRIDAKEFTSAIGGFRTIEWNNLQSNGSDIEPGLYMYRLYINGIDKIFTGKILKN